MLFTILLCALFYGVFVALASSWLGGLSDYTSLFATPAVPRAGRWSPSPSQLGLSTGHSGPLPI